PVLPRLIEPKLKVQVLDETVTESLLPPPSLSVTVTWLLPLMLWLLASPDHVEQNELTLICSENVITIVSPSSRRPAVPPPLLSETELTVGAVVSTVNVFVGLEPVFSAASVCDACAV